MPICGTCLNHRYYEEDGVYHDYCALDPDRLCGYCVTACEEYGADVDYIKFMGFDKEDVE